MLIIPIFVNGLLTLSRHDRRHLYDLMAGTVVVERPETVDTSVAAAPFPSAASPQGGEHLGQPP